LEYKNEDILEDKDFSEIYVETKKQYPKINKNDVLDILHSKSQLYNPLKVFIEQHRYLISEGKTKGLIRDLVECICSDTGLSEACFDADYEEYFARKWFIGMIASIYGNISPLLIALTGKKNTGKTEFFRRLFPDKIKKYFAQMKLSIEKDSEIAMTRYLIIFDDELAGKSKLEEKHLKEFTSKRIFTFRPPYGKTPIQRKRLAVLCGTTNDDAILSDPTGNRRIIPIRVLSINFEKYNSIDKTCLFMEAVRLYESGEKWDLTNEDIERLENTTISHVAENLERELIQKYFDKPETDTQESFARFMTTTDILIILEDKTKQKLSIRKIGLEMRMLKYDRIQKKYNRKGYQSYGYLVIPKSVLAE
jgi:predicted P-loop ATPase